MILLFSLSSIPWAYSQEHKPCPEVEGKRFGRFKVSRYDATNNPDFCVMSVWHGDHLYGLTSEGALNLSDTPYHVHHATVYSYYFFPRKQNPDFKIMTTGDMEITTASGHKLRISEKTGRLVEISNAKLDSMDSMKIASAQFLYLDLGSRTGEGPLGRKIIRDKKTKRILRYEYRESTFRDGSGKSCTVRNDQIADYPTDAPDNMDGKVKSDAELYAYLSKHPKCKELNLESLRDGHPGKITQGISGSISDQVNSRSSQ